jgi:type I restriction enzyme S subunit
MKQGWKTKKIGDVCVIRPKKAEAKKKLKDGDMVSFVPMNDLGIDQKCFSVNEEKPLSSVYSSYTYFEDNDVLLAKITPCFENGKLGIARELTNGVGFGSSEYVVFRAKEELDPVYLYYFLLRERFRREGSAVMTGAVGHRRVPPDFISNYKIPLPDISQQKIIVKILDETFDRIDQAITIAKKNCENARDIYEHHVGALFSDKIDENWEEKTLAEVCEKITQGPNPKYNKKEDDLYRVLKTKNLYDDVIDYEGADKISAETFDTCLSAELQNGDLLLAIVGQGSINKCNVFENKTAKRFIFTRALGLIRAKKSVISPYFLKIFFQSKHGKQLINKGIGGTSGQQVVTTSYIKSLLIPVPSLSEQKEIIRNSDILSAETKRLEETYQKKVEELEALKQSILDKAFRGELSVSQHDNVISFPAADISQTDLHAGIIARTYQKHEQVDNLATLGRVKAEKIVHLVEYHAGVDLNRNPIKDAAGPNDFTRLLSVEGAAKNSQYFETYKERGRYKFRRFQNLDQIANTTGEALGERKEEVDRIIGLLTPMRTQQAEVVTTVYAAWNNLLIDGADIDDDKIVYEARENWHEAKKKIERNKFVNAIQWLKNNNLVPTGHGKRVGEPQLL